MRYDQGDYSTIYDMFALWISEITTVGLSTLYWYVLCTFHKFTVYIHNKKYIK